MIGQTGDYVTRDGAPVLPAKLVYNHNNNYFNTVTIFQTIVYHDFMLVKTRISALILY